MRTYIVSLYNIVSKRRADRKIEAKSLLEAWMFANGSCHGTNWIAKGIRL